MHTVYYMGNGVVKRVQGKTTMKGKPITFSRLGQDIRVFGKLLSRQKIKVLTPVL